VIGHVPSLFLVQHALLLRWSDCNAKSISRKNRIATEHNENELRAENKKPMTGNDHGFLLVPAAGFELAT
jgi:hypothetical protein